MQKIAIVLDDMSIGGIPKACASFVNQLIEYYDVTMIMRRDDGELISLLPKEVHIQLIKHEVFRDVVEKRLAEHRYFRLIKYAIPYLFWSRICNRWVKANEMTAKENGAVVDGDFDCAIAYHGMSISHMVTALHSVRAKKTVAWIHGDHPFEGVHKKDAEKVYQEFDKIYCVSPVMLERFLKDFPSVVDISESYKNILEIEKIKKLSSESVESFDDSFVNLVTVGRVSREKGQDLIPRTAKLLLEKSLKIKWYIVGDGDDTEWVKQLCREEGVEDSVIFVGAKQNPYPYMRSCDIYVQPSYTEGYCLTVCEAAILGKPIVLTAAAAAILNDENAIVTESNADSIADGIQRIIENPEMRMRFIKELNGMDLSNRDEIEKLNSFLNH